MPVPTSPLRVVSGLVTLCVIVLSSAIGSTGHATELIVVDQVGCPYCERFEAEIAPVWPNTAEGRRAPLRHVDLHGDWPADLDAVGRASVTPTFILVEDGREIDRLIGYPGDEHFWFLIGELFEQLDADGTPHDAADGIKG